MASYFLAPINNITINRTDRQRRELKDIDELVASIREHGVLQPVIVDKNLTLIAGERRLTACVQLGLFSIPAMVQDELSEAQAYVIELEENVQRQQLPWQDECKAIHTFHEMKKAEEPKWSMEKTSTALNMGLDKARKSYFVAEGLMRGDTAVIQASTYSAAVNIVMRKRERAAQAAVADLPDITDLAAGKSDKPKRTNTVVATSEPATTPEPEDSEEVPEAPFLHTEFYEWMKSSPQLPEKINFIHCDFPYGINHDKSDMGAGETRGIYEDSVDTYTRLLSELDEFIQGPLCAESLHVLFWFQMKHYKMTLASLESMGLKVLYMPLVWVKSDNVGILPDPKRGPRFIYETALLCSRGDRKIVQPVANAVSTPTTRTLHPTEKPEAMLSHFFRMFVDESTVMLDPTCGSGSAVRAAEKMGARFALGLERDKDFFSDTVRYYLKEKE